MPRGMPQNIKPMREYSVAPKTRTDVADALKSHYQGYIIWEGVEGFIARLPIKLQQAIILYHREGRTGEEAAEIMGCGRTTISVYLSQARRLILDWARSEWGEMGE